MSVPSEVKAVLADFEKENPKLKDKAYLSKGGGSRTWQDQLDIILQPKRKKNYLNIKKRFKTKYMLDELPKKRANLTKEQLSWWKTEIMKQAGKPKGFAHVGGKAQDVSVRKLGSEAKKKLKTKLEQKGLKILMEKVSEGSSKYGVSLSHANVFHVYK